MRTSRAVLFVVALETVATDPLRPSIPGSTGSPAIAPGGRLRR